MVSEPSTRETRRSGRPEPTALSVCVRVLPVSLGVAFAALGCLPWRQKPAERPLLVVVPTLDPDTYRPGEAVVCTVKVTNAGNAPAPAGSLSADTVEFWFGPTGTDLRYRREPVRSSREKGFEAITIAPKSSITRRFVLTRLTEEEGHFALHVLYSPEGNAPGTPGIPGPAFLYRVDGQRLFRRDENGLIRKEDAVESVKQKVGSGLANAEARLVRNEAGLLDWLVTAEVQGGDSAARRAFLVNPYTGVIRVEAKPQAGAHRAAKEKTETSY